MDRRARLESARLYLCVGPRPRDWLKAVCDAGVDVIQLRDQAKTLEGGPLCVAGEEFRAAADDSGALFIMNDRPDVAFATGADGVHLGQDDLPLDAARALLGPEAIIGRSTRTPEHLEQAALEDCEYFCAGPVWETPTKPGRPAAGIGVIERAEILARGKPWFAIGGIDESNITEVAAAGGRRVVVVRAITEADDPPAAVRRLRAALP